MPFYQLSRRVGRAGYLAKLMARELLLQAQTLGLIQTGAPLLSVNKPSRNCYGCDPITVSNCAPTKDMATQGTPQKLADNLSCLQSKAEPSMAWLTPTSHYPSLTIFFFCNTRRLTIYPPNSLLLPVYLSPST